jgi:hypothetical protein
LNKTKTFFFCFWKWEKKDKYSFSIFIAPFFHRKKMERKFHTYFFFIVNFYVNAYTWRIK